MDYRDRHVIVTGGTGALGTATVAALIDAGAVCHVPYIDQAEADRFPLRNHANIEFVADVDLSQESGSGRMIVRRVPFYSSQMGHLILKMRDSLLYRLKFLVVSNHL